MLEDAPDGSFVIRYWEGTNAGMVLVHRFVEVRPGVTEVQLSADAPSTLGRKLLGPLFVVGARQVMKKALAEDKRDLEAGNFRPGVAAGNIEHALATTQRDAIARVAALLGASSSEAAPTSLLDRSEKLAETEVADSQLGSR